MQSLAAAASGGYCHIWLLLRLAAFVFERDSFSSHSTSCVSSFTEGLENRWSVSKSPYVGFVQQLSASSQTFYCFGFSPRTWQGFTSSLAADSLPISRAAACRPARLPLTHCRSLVRRLSCGDTSCQLDWVAMFDAGNIFHCLSR